MRKHDRGSKPHLRPVTRIELSEQNIKTRTILLVVFLSIGIVALVIGLFQFVNVEPGWHEIQVNSDQPNCGSEFTLMCDFSDYGGSATEANRQLIRLYTQATEDAFRIFSPDVEDPGQKNLQYLNSHPNEVVSVDPVLYEAFALLEQYGNRSVYLAPVYDEYQRIFLCENPQEAALYDPAYNVELVPYITQAAAYANDPEMIRVELLGENRVKLTVSESYLAFIREYEIDTLADFSWMRNAFTADYIARVLQEQGFTCGYIASFDGFTRNLDQRQREYSINVFHRQDTDIFIPAQLCYSGAMSLVVLRDFPLSQEDRWHYFTYESGDTTTIHLDSTDGRSKASIDSLTCYSSQTGCSEILLQMIPVYIAENFQTEPLGLLAQQQIYSLWCDATSVCHNDPDARLTLLPERSGTVTEIKKVS